MKHVSQQLWYVNVYTLRLFWIWMWNIHNKNNIKLHTSWFCNEDGSYYIHTQVHGFCVEELKSIHSYIWTPRKSANSHREADTLQLITKYTYCGRNTWFNCWYIAICFCKLWFKTDGDIFQAVRQFILESDRL